MKGKKDQPEPARPLCMCGSPGAFQVQIDVQELRLERDAGITSRPYWTPKYRSGTKIEAIMCQACVRANVQLQVVATAKVEKAKEVVATAKVEKAKEVVATAKVEKAKEVP